jgi:hypothetical protein
MTVQRLPFLFSLAQGVYAWDDSAQRLPFLFSLAQGVYAWDDSGPFPCLAPFMGLPGGLEASADWLKPTREAP